MAAGKPAAQTHSFAPVVHSWRHWWHNSVVKTVDQAEVIASRREEAMLSARYLFMLAMSAGIAILGLLLSSPAVVIGAMLLSPLMGPIIGLGFALATGDFQWMRQSAKSLAIGTLLAIFLCAVVVFLSPLQTVTPEIAARTRPNLFDLLIALFSALAGAYAMIRGRMGTVVGVAIATALMPPLAVVGFGLATLNWTVFSGALMLYVTNLLTIALTAMVMARLYGFRTSLSERQTQLQTVVVLVAFTGLAIPLGISLYKIAWEAQTTREIRGDVLDAFNGKARLSQFDIEYGTAPIQITVTVLTPNLRPDAENIVQRAAERALGKPAKVGITQYEVGTSAKAAEQAQLSAARAKQEAAAQQQRQQTENLVGQLALVAGVAPGDVVIDSDRRKALVTTKPLPGAGLAAYRALEQRVAASVPDWQVELTPPARALPDVGFANGEPTDAGKQAIALIQWAAQRIHAPLVLEGSKVNTDRLAALLGAKAVETSARVTWRHPDSVKVSWGTPGGG